MISERKLWERVRRAAESLEDAAREVLNETPSTPHDSAVPDPDPRLESGLTYCRDCGDPLIACECEEPEGMPEPVAELFDAIRNIRDCYDGGTEEREEWTRYVATVRTLVQRAERAERERDSAEEVAVRSGEIQQKRIRELEDLRDRLKLEAEIHAGEARAANATIHEIYQAVTEGRGEPGTWNGAKPVREELDRLRERVRELEAELREEGRKVDALEEHCAKLAARPQVTDKAVEAAARATAHEVDPSPEAWENSQNDFRREARAGLEAAIDHMTPRPGGGEPMDHRHDAVAYATEAPEGERERRMPVTEEDVSRELRKRYPPPVDFRPELAPPEQTEGDPTYLRDLPEWPTRTEVINEATVARGDISREEVAALAYEYIGKIRARLSPTPTASGPLLERRCAACHVEIERANGYVKAGDLITGVRPARELCGRCVHLCHWKEDGTLVINAHPTESMRRVSRAEWDELRATLIKGVDMTGDAWRNVDWIMAKMRLAVGIEIEGEEGGER